MTLRASIPVLTYSVIAADDIAADQLVGWDNKPTTEDAVVQGVALTDAAAGEVVTLTAIGLIDLMAGGAIFAGEALISDADGLPTPALAAVPPVGEDPGSPASANPFGHALNDAVQGGRVTVLIR